MTKRKVSRRDRVRRNKVSPYRRLELELGFVRAALSDAAAQYARAVQALADLLDYFDGLTGHPLAKRMDGWTAADVQRIRKIRQIAEGK